jgi:long-chain fatty acid transport protein
MRRTAVLCTAGLIATFAGRDALAQGFSVYEHDACTMARSGTAVAAPCSGGSAVFFNPAGIVGSETRWNFSAGATLITLDFNYRDSITGRTTDAVKNNIPVPAAYLTRQLGSRMALGIGVFAPYGLKVEWPTDFEGRFLAYSSDLKTIYVQPTLAYRVTPWLRVGGGFNFVHTIVELRQRVDLSAQAAPAPAPAGTTLGMLGVPVGTDFADAVVDATGNSFTAHLGVIVEPHPRVSIGARYLLGTTADIEGEAVFTQVPTGITLAAGNPFGAPGGTPLDAIVAPQFSGSGLLTTQSAATSIPLPSQLVVGVAFRATPRLTLLADYQLTTWQDFELLTLDFGTLPDRTLYEDYENSHGYRFGAEYRGNRMTFRAGYLYHTAAAPAQTVTPLLPEGERSEFTLGLGIPVGSRLRIDVAYQNITQQDRRGRVVEPPVRGPTGASVNSGLYAGGANLFGASLAWGF